MRMHLPQACTHDLGWHRSDDDGEEFPLAFMDEVGKTYARKLVTQGLVTWAGRHLGACAAGAGHVVVFQ